MRERQKMQTFDWLIFAGLAAVGLYLGVALDGMVALASTGSWSSVILILVLSAGGIVFYLLAQGVFEFISTGRFSAPKQLQKPRKPLALILALPLGLIVGMVGAQFGLSKMLL